MKYALTFLFCLLSLPAHATKLAVCDGKTYTLIITNGGQAHEVTLTPVNGAVEEFGPNVSMQIKGDKRIVTIDEPDDEYCIWNGKINIQTRNIGAPAHGGQ